MVTGVGWADQIRLAIAVRCVSFEREPTVTHHALRCAASGLGCARTPGVGIIFQGSSL